MGTLYDKIKSKAGSTKATVSGGSTGGSLYERIKNKQSGADTNQFDTRQFAQRLNLSKPVPSAPRLESVSSYSKIAPKNFGVGEPPKAVFGIPQSTPRAPVGTTAESTAQDTVANPLSVTKGVIEGTKAVGRFAQEIPRGIAGTAAQGAAYIAGIPQSKVSLDPTKMGPLGTALLGRDKIQPAKEGSDLLALIPGISDETAQKFGPGAYALLTISDFLTGPGKKEAALRTIKTLTEPAGARRFLREAGIADDIITELKLDAKAVAAKTDAEAEAIFREAIEATGKKTPAPTNVIDNSFTEKDPIKAFEQSKNQTKIGDSNFVIGDYGNNTIKRKIVEKQQDRLPVSELKSTVENITQTYKAGDSSFRKDNLIHISTMPNGETRAVVSRINPQGKEEVINFFKISKDKDTFVKNLESFGTPERTRTSNLIGRNDTLSPLSYGDTPTIAQDTKSARLQSELPQLPKLPANAVVGTPDEIIASAKQRYTDTANRPDAPQVPQQTWKSRLAESTIEAKDNAKIIANKLLVPISSRLERINPKLKEVLRKLEFASAQNTMKDSKAVLPFLDSLKKISKEDMEVFSLALNNGDVAVTNAIGIKYNLQKEIQAVRNTLNDLHARGNAVGMDIGFRENYFPRMVKNPRKYVAYLRQQEDWSVIQEIVEKRASELGRKYTDLSAEEITAIVNNYLRGYGEKVALATPNFAKSRTIEVVDEVLNEFYAPPSEALSTYIIRMNDEIEGRKFFGKALGADEKILNTQDSIGAYVMDLIAKKEIKPEMEEEVADILRSRFARGKMNGLIDAYRNVEYVSTMGSPISAITQIGDLAWSVYDAGFFNTARGFGKSITKNADRITKEDLGIEQITQEFTKQSTTGKALDKVFKLVGMERLDRLGKETLINAEFDKFTQLAQKNDPAILKILKRTFDEDEVETVMKEFADGKITENTKLVLFNKLLDFQPVAKSEMPQVYLEHPNGRIFYMLKSYQLKQYDIFRREALDKIGSGQKDQVIEGMRNLIAMSSALVLMNATADEIKDAVLGRETSMSDRVVDNFWRLLGASKYDVYKARTDGVGATILKKLLFPTSLIDRGGKDIANLIEGKEYEKGPMAGEAFKLESTQSIPVAGKLYYWWFGRGDQKEDYKEGGTSSTALPGLPPLPKLPSLPNLPSL